jgi:predicted RNA-binding Zn-ribbon protein involved in translation (DUF1610 family)
MKVYECPDCGWDLQELDDNICFCTECNKEVDKLDAKKKNFKE